MELLLRCDDVQVDSGAKNGQTTLSFAAESGSKDVVHLLLPSDDVQMD